MSSSRCNARGAVVAHSGEDHREKSLTQLYQLNVHRMKMLLWRLLRGCLPTRDCRHARGIPWPVTCELCSSYIKNEWHLIFGCREAQKLRAISSLNDAMQNAIREAGSLTEVLFNLIFKATHGQREEIVAIAWKMRNNKKWPGKEPQP
ncbi:hypothetical protein Fmac_023524 [Flemingia macrophylla]|uniref:Reverse transcriptase zinc-binding domain-containing protein n=1 Tax=Flemingia macrophylla TaxID=520843 RepID=A0ABD1LLU5_9FABA